MAKTGSVVWVEGQPETAVFCGSSLAVFWRMNGPTSFAAMFKGKRMSRVRPIGENVHPVVAARECEKVMRRRAAWV